MDKKVPKFTMRTVKEPPLLLTGAQRQRQKVAKRVYNQAVESLRSLSIEKEDLDKQLDKVIADKDSLKKEQLKFVTKLTPSGNVHMNAKFLPGYEEAGKKIDKAHDRHAELYNRRTEVEKMMKDSPLAGPLDRNNPQVEYFNAFKPRKKAASKLMKRTQNASK